MYSHHNSDDEGTVYYKNTDTFKVTPNLATSDLKAAQDSLKRIAAANQTDSLKQALASQGEQGIGTHRSKKNGTVKSGYSTVKRRSKCQQLIWNLFSARESLLIPCLI